jgi:hypothetical protein
MSVTFNVLAATGPQLLAFFNENTGGAKVTKFRDRPTAEKRVQRLVDEMKAEDMVEDMGIKSQKEAAHIIAAALAPTVIEDDELSKIHKSLAFPKLTASEKTVLAETVVLKSVEHDTVTKPWQRAKVIVCDMVSQGITSRKEIIAACVAAGIKYNTADGAHYSIVVQGRAK